MLERVAVLEEKCKMLENIDSRLRAIETKLNRVAGFVIAAITIIQVIFGLWKH